jgi:hypothetical protein
LVFKKYQFAPLSNTFIKVTITLPGGKGSSFDTMMIFIQPSPLIANIIGGDRNVGRPEDLKLQAIIIDPDQVI